MDQALAGDRLHLFVQRAPLALCGYRAFAARPRGQPSTRPQADGRDGPADFASSSDCCSTPRRRPKYAVYYGEGRDAYDIRGRTAHESIFNVNDGAYRCPNSQQGYSPFSTWTRGLAWILCGYLEQIEFLDTLPDAELAPFGGKEKIITGFLKVAEAVADFYLEQTPIDGVPYWDTGAPGLAKMGDYLDRPAEPYNDHEPVDSSAAAIAAQGLLRLGNFHKRFGEADKGARYYQAGLTVAQTLFREPYLSTDPHHEGLLLHSVYHRPNGWDYIPPGQKVPCGEASMWGDYHARELAVYLHRAANKQTDLRFFDILFPK